jgi:fibronectin-binding autotransporter adhesin
VLGTGGGYLNSTLNNYEMQAGAVYTGLMGGGGLNKTGPGTVTLYGVNSYAGKTTIAGGTLKLSASSTTMPSSVVEFKNGAILNSADLTVLALSGKTLQGNGAITGNVAMASSMTLNAGLASVVAGSDKISVQGNLDVESYSAYTVNVSALGSSFATGVDYPVLTYSGNLLSYGSPTTIGPTVTVFDNTRYNFTSNFDTASKQLTVKATSGSALDLTWSGPSYGYWDVGDFGTLNWNAGAERFYDLDRVTFNGGSAGTISLSAAVRPGAIAIADSQDYEFAGTGSISGAPTFTKSGSGILTLSTANDFSSDLTVNDGTLKINSLNALGTADGKTNLSGNAVLDTNGFTIGNEEVVVGGSGNARIGNFAVAYTAQGIGRLTLNANVTIGGSDSSAPGPTSSEYRLDLRDSDGTGFLNGNGKKITKVGANRLFLLNLGDTNLGDFDIQAGYVGVYGDTTLGTSGTVSVAGGAAFQFYNSSMDIAKAFSLADSAILMVSNSALTPKISGNVALAGATSVQIDDSYSLTLSGDVSGAGGLTLLDYTGTTGGTGGTLILDGGKSYTGPTSVSAGVLSLTGSGASAIASSLITVNTRLNVTSGGHTVNAIDGTGIVSVVGGSSLTAGSISVSTLSIGAPPAAAAVPEPGTLVLLTLAGLALAGGFLRRK